MIKAVRQVFGHGIDFTIEIRPSADGNAELSIDIAIQF
jgi:hypothetical protein